MRQVDVQEVARPTYHSDASGLSNNSTEFAQGGGLFEFGAQYGNVNLGSRLSVELQNPSNAAAMYTIPANKGFIGRVIVVNQSVTGGALGVSVGGTTVGIASGLVTEAVTADITVTSLTTTQAIAAVVTGSALGSVVVEGYVK
jgi:hypothetical protein